jgi:hypothetical protein
METFDLGAQTAVNKPNVSTIRSITAIFWLGFFVAISFMEAPLKFTAPHLGLAEGLQIGRIIFGALNKCEWAFLAIIIVTCFFKNISRRELYLIVIVGTILIIETAWLLPVLNGAAERVIKGQPASAPQFHLSYIFLEILKIPVLLLIGSESYRTRND